jgi:hypothetical protein
VLLEHEHGRSPEVWCRTRPEQYGVNMPRPQPRRTSHLNRLKRDRRVGDYSTRRFSSPKRIPLRAKIL